ncbi:MAG: HlyD family efflux transporter periplasmic adaptor subunit [Pirellulaceae bacterium]|nr:HlyD family efflux transporter periplasmic adaptor subunit [Pirellulaceae bacterium]MDP6557292.1 HlyD family efflux transporter periplasmic adaptor subunit [Pirellulaceae bacterium]
MTGATQSLASGASRPLRMRTRSDLTIEQHIYLGRKYWIVKDRLAQKYYRFEEEEFALLEMLDGQASLQDIQAEFERRFAPQKITTHELHQLVSMLHRSALVVSDAAGQGQQLYKRHVATSHRQKLGALTNVLCIRFKGFDPDRLLTWLDRRVGWLFSVPCLVLSLILTMSAALLIGVQFDIFWSRMPGFHAFFASENWIWLSLTLAVTKVLHEFGHGLSCKRLGGECHEMGMMMLVLTPCLYCNVSDSWMLPNKWHRAAIGAAGMYVEIVLASICTFVWWFTHPGLLNYVCFNVMFVCSVSTLLFNANPLLRYDGYYILSDLVEIPNLRQKASTILQRKLGSWCLGLTEPPDPFLPQRRQSFFAIYCIAAAAYRWLVVFGILWFLYEVFEPYGLKIIGQLIAVMSLYGLLVAPLWKLCRFFYVPGRMDQVNKPRMIASVAGTAIVLLAIFLVPLPYYTNCSLYLQLRDAASVYVETPGAIKRIHVRDGQWVERDQPLLTLGSLDVQISIAQIEGAKRQLESRRIALLQRSFEDESAAAEIAEVQEALAARDEQLQNRQRDARRLAISAPLAGWVIPPPRVPEAPRNGANLPSWSGTPLEPRNRNAFLPEGVPVCQIGDPRHLEAILAIDQGDMEFVHKGQAVDIMFEQLPGQRFRSQISQISQLDMKVMPQSLSSKSGGDLVTRTDQSGHQRPDSTTYQGSASIDDEDGLLLVGATGTAKIHTGYRTVAQRAWRYLCQTFNLEV